MSPLTKKEELSSESNQILGFSTLPALLAFGGLCLLLFFAPSQLAIGWPWTNDFGPQSLFLLLLAFVSVMVTIARLDIPKPDALFWLVSGLLGWIALSVSAASYKHDAYLELARITGAFAVFYLCRMFPARSHRIALVLAAALGMVWPSLLALFVFVTTHSSRQAGTFANSNMFANALAAMLPLAIVIPVAIWVQTRQKSLTLAGAIPALLLLPALAITSSKGGFLAAIIGILVTIVALRDARKQAFGSLFRRVLPLVIVGGLGFGVLAAKTVLPRLMAARTTEDNSTQFRVYLWRSTLKMVEDKPLLGHGPAQFPTDFPAYALAGYAKTAHQSWLQLGAESGVLAVLMLGAAIVCAFVAAKNSLKSENWPFAAGAIGTLCAILVHGCADAGWNAIPVVMLLALALALVSVPPTTPAKQNLNFFWLGTTLLLALGGYGSQIAAGSEDAIADSDYLLEEKRDARGAVDTLQSKLTSDVGSAKLWGSWGRLQGALQFGNAEESLQKAIDLQPHRAANYVNMARFKIARGDNPQEIDALFNKAQELNPINSTLLLERAKWRIETKNGKGYDDLRQIIKLWDEPFGKYPALDEWVNLDFTRALILLWPKLSPQQRPALKKHALADLAKARQHQAGNLEVLKQAETPSSLDSNSDLDELESQLQALK